MDTTPAAHFYKCAMCGGDYMAAMGETGLHLTSQNQVKKTPVMECFKCGGQMRVVMVAGEPMSGSTLNQEGTASKTETILAWRCDCGAIEKFSDEDILW
jgi:hypothetical protein